MVEAQKGLPSPPRKRGSRASDVALEPWIPAFAGMTKKVSRRAWLVGLSLYAIAGAAAATLFLNHEARAGEDWWAPDNLAVAFSAGLFWPVDLVAKSLLAH